MGLFRWLHIDSDVSTECHVCGAGIEYDDTGGYDDEGPICLECCGTMYDEIDGDDFF